MKQAILSALIVLVCGYIGGFLGIAGCVMASFASATGCIVYAVNRKNKSN